MKTIEITWNNGTKSEIHSDRKMTETMIIGYIKDALKSGEEISGAELITNTGVVIR